MIKNVRIRNFKRFKIANIMKPEEIVEEVKEKLDFISDMFGLSN